MSSRFQRTIAAALMIGLAGEARADTRTLQLAVEINGYSIREIGEFVLRDGVLMARRSELTALGFRIPDASLAAAVEINALIPLSGLSRVTARIDQATQTIFITAADASLLPALLHVDDRLDARGRVESGTGATLNYDITATTSGGRTVGSGLLDLRVFSPWGVVSTSALAYLGGGPGGFGSNALIRLDSTYTFSDPDALRRYRVGDFINSSLGWTRSIRIGGLQITTDFGLRPDLVTFPLPTISGSAVVPSTLDVLVNGNRLLSQQVGAGPFQIPQLPVVTGAGTVSLTVTNALGRQVVVNLPFYASADLLKPGLQSYSAQIGAVRRNWGVVSNDYGVVVGIATYRRGMSPALTLEANAEAANGLVKGGGGLVLNLGNFAVMNAAAAISTGTGRGGTQYSIGVQRISTVFSAGASVTMASSRFNDVASLDGDAVPALQINANIGLSLGRFGSAGLAYAGVDRRAVPAAIEVFLPPGATPVPGGTLALYQPEQHAHVLAVSYSVEVRRLSISVTAFRDFANSHSSGAQISLTLPLGTRSSASASGSTGSSGRSGQVQVQQSIAKVGDWGYQAYASAGDSGHEFGQLQYDSRVALISGGIDRAGKQITLTAEAQGAVSFVGGGLFASNLINDSFAIVDTSGLAKVRVLNENRLVGVTDAAGRLLVPNLRSFDTNYIAIDPDDIPQDASIDTTARRVRPQDRSGVVVKFQLKIGRSALVIMVNDAGAAIPLGSTATLRSSQVIVPVGYGGDAFLQDLEPHNVLTIERPDGSECSVTFDYRPTPGEIPRIGPLRCREPVAAERR